jgi:hypothetical protein
MTLREQVVRELIDSVGIETISHMADRILALVKDDARRREREAFVEGVRWEMGNPAGPGHETAGVEAARRYKEEVRA